MGTKESQRIESAIAQAAQSASILQAALAYRRLNLKAKDARQIAQDLVRAGLLAEVTLDGAEGYTVTRPQRAA